jgi:hypothetical protein
VKIIEEYKNPCRTRWVERFNSLPEEIQDKIEHIDDMPKEALYLKPIKRKRTPDIEEGTIFAVKTPEDVFFFGKVINKDLELPNIDEGFFVVFFFNKGSKYMEHYPIEFTYENILLGPMILGEGLWKNGTCYTVGHHPLTTGEKELKYGFYKEQILNKSGLILNANGYVMDKEPIFLSWCAYTTIYGIERGLRIEFIINPSLLEKTD